MTSLAESSSATNPAPEQGISPEKDALLASVVAEYLAACRAGERPDVDALVAQHPEIAADLTACLASLEFLENISQQERLFTRPAGQSDNENDNGAVSRRAEGTLGDYRILGEIGRGGMGVVYEAEQISLHRRVALKVLPFAAILDDRAEKRFQNEALAAAQLDHPHIVDVYGVGCERGIHYYAMRLIEGRSLAEIIQHLREQFDANPRYSPSSLADLVSSAQKAAATQPITDDTLSNCFPAPNPHSQFPTIRVSTTRKSRPKLGGDYYRAIATVGMYVAEALDHAHEQGVLHRDIKPSNLMLDSSGKVWITDFGLARIEAAASLTHTGDLLGTLRYMSPEQVHTKRVPIDHRSDIYSLGVTLYELLTLKPAFDGENRGELLRQIAFDKPMPPRKLNSLIPVDLETILLKAIEKDPRSRFDSAGELAQDLRSFLEQKMIRARRPTILSIATRWGHRHSHLLLVAFAIVTMTATILGVATWRMAILRSQAVEAAAREKIERARASRNFERAIGAIRDLVGTARATGREDASGDLYLRVIDKAIELTMKCLEEPATDALGRRQHALAYLLLSIAHSEAYRHTEACAAGDTAISILKDLHVRFPEEVEYKRDLQYAIQQRAIIHKRAGNVSEARKDLETSIKLLYQLRVSLPLDTELSLRLASAHFLLGEELMSMTNPDLDAVAGEYRASLDALVDAMRQDTKNAVYRKQFLSLITLFSIRLRQDAFLKECTVRMRRVAQEHPDITADKDFDTILNRITRDIK